MPFSLIAIACTYRKVARPRANVVFWKLAVDEWPSGTMPIRLFTKMKMNSVPRYGV